MCNSGMTYVHPCQNYFLNTDFPISRLSRFYVWLYSFQLIVDIEIVPHQLPGRFDNSVYLFASKA